MSSCMAAAAGSILNPSSAAAAATSFAFDHIEIEIFKSNTTSTRKSSPRSSPSSPTLTSSSSPSSTISEASDVLSPHLRLSTRKPRTPRKRPNQTYNEAAVLLSTAYPSIFSTESLLVKPPFKLSKRVEPNWAIANSELGEDDLLLPLSISPKPINVGRRNFETRLALLGSRSNCTDTNGKQCLSSPVVEQQQEEQQQEEGEDEEDESRWSQFDQINEEHDATIHAGSILDEETGKGIDSIMGNLTANNNSYSSSSYNYSNCQHHQQKTSNFCYGIPIGLGLGLLGSNNKFNFGFGMARGVRALRNWQSGGGADDDWWRCPVATVDVGAISPRLESKDEQPPPALSSDKKKSKKKKAKVKEEEEDAADKGKVKAAEAGGGESYSTAAAMGGTENKIKLKLDYDDVLRAWSDKGSMFSEDFGGSELAGGDALSRLAQIDLFGENGGVREASVQRYKEKRRSRLFSKKIRYQVRKANADQRPRMKGRFVRNNSESTGGGQAQ